jgi:hypothetical protein
VTVAERKNVLVRLREDAERAEQHCRLRLVDEPKAGEMELADVHDALRHAVALKRAVGRWLLRLG